MRTLLALGCLAAALALAATAAADSLVYVKDNNVWLANADGSSPYQVTLDGTPGSPYSSPSLADDGTIVALRAPAGARTQIWRMHQNGGLVNPPINTPAPGTGALDARVSPDGTLVAYWFVTQVSTGTCLYCWDLSQRVLISHVDRFTNPDEAGLTPNTGGWPSWMSNNRLMLSIGAAEEWYYQLGTKEAVSWWGDFDNCGLCQPAPARNLTDGEVSRDGQRIAVVRGDSEETIALYQTTGPPPPDGTAPPKPTPTCAFTGPNGGKFVRPTWSQDGQTLAWQEGNGIWSSHIPDFSNCPALTSQLIVPGGTDPDFGPAAVNPGARPGCGNPGNPTTCSGPTPPGPTPPGPTPPGPVVNLARQLSALLSSYASALRRMAIHGLVRAHKISVAFTAPGAGTLTLSLSTTGRHSFVVANARVVFSKAGKRTVGLTLTRKGLRTLRHARSLRGSLKVTFTPRGGKAVSSKLGVSIAK